MSDDSEIIFMTEVKAQPSPPRDEFGRVKRDTPPDNTSSISLPPGRDKVAAVTYPQKRAEPRAKSDTYKEAGTYKKPAPFVPSEGDWPCPDPACGNVNFARRTNCNRCKVDRPVDGKTIEAPPSSWHHGPLGPPLAPAAPWPSSGGVHHNKSGILPQPYSGGQHQPSIGPMHKPKPHPSLPNSVMHVGGSVPPPPSSDWAPPPNDWAPPSNNDWAPPPNNDWAPPPGNDWAAPPSDWAASTTDWIPPHDWAPSTEPSGQGVLPWPSTPMTPVIGADGLPVKQPITYRDCVLYPPNPTAPPPTTRERPPGCRTIFIGGLPELCTEETVVDVFGKCGEVQTVRMSKKNFCHIRYSHEYCVDNAVYLSGWRMRLENSCEANKTGRLHVDFAQARDDLYEWECKNRSVIREQRHIITDLRPPSPPPLPHYTDHEAHMITEQFRVGDIKELPHAVTTLLTWLERGDCSKRNAQAFYNMIQAANSQVKKLLGERSEWEAEVARAKEELRTRLQSQASNFGQIERVLAGCSVQKVWDHFTKAQRKNIQAWRKLLTNAQTESSRQEEEDMDLSDEEEKGEEPAKKKKKFNPDKLREESEEWACQAQVWRNEVENMKAEMKSDVQKKDQQIRILQQTLQGMQQQLIEAQSKQGSLPAFLLPEGKAGAGGKAAGKAGKAPASDKEKVLEKVHWSIETVIDKVIEVASPPVEDESFKIYLPPQAAKAGAKTAAAAFTARGGGGGGGAGLVDDARLLAVVATFLNVHPFGAGTDYIRSYLARVEPGVKHGQVEDLLSRFPQCFSATEEGVGAGVSRSWRLVAFTTPKV